LEGLGFEKRSSTHTNVVLIRAVLRLKLKILRPFNLIKFIPSTLGKISVDLHGMSDQTFDMIFKAIDTVEIQMRSMCDWANVTR